VRIGATRAIEQTFVGRKAAITSETLEVFGTLIPSVRVMFKDGATDSSSRSIGVEAMVNGGGFADQMLWRRKICFHI
jgi:hypothetical protein